MIVLWLRAIRVHQWAKNTLLLKGYVAGDTAGNLAFAAQENASYLHNRIIVSAGARHDHGDTTSTNKVVPVTTTTSTSGDWSSKYGAVVKPLPATDYMQKTKAKQ